MGKGRSLVAKITISEHHFSQILLAVSHEIKSLWSYQEATKNINKRNGNFQMATSFFLKRSEILLI